MTELDGSELLRELDGSHAFDPIALPGQRALLYVPFEELVSGRHEGRVLDALRNTHRIALVAPIGAGKSSLIEYVVTLDAETFAPIWVSASHEDTRVLKDPPEFARHLIRQVVGWARGIRAMTEDERRAFLVETSRTLPSRTRRSRQSFSLKLALGWIEPGVSREVEETLADPEVDRNRADFVDSLDRLITLVREDLQRTPVVVIDDSDRWLRLATADREALLDGFFGDTCRMLAERNWAVIMAVHPEYCAAPAFRRALANGYFGVQIDVPQIRDAAGIKQVFDVRIRIAAQAAAERLAMEAGTRPVAAVAGADDVFEAGFESILFRYYRATGGNLRSVLTVAQQALQEAIGMDEAVVGNASLREAVLALAS